MTVVNINNAVNETKTSGTTFPEVLKEFYFMDSHQTEPYPKWFRTPYIRGDQLANYLAEFDPREHEGLRIQSMFDLYQMVNDKGMNKDECEAQNVEFEPYCQKAQWMFGDLYEITQETFEHLSKGSGDLETYYVFPKSRTSCDFSDVDERPNTDDISRVVIDISLWHDFQKEKIADLTSQINEIYLKKGGTGIWTNFSGICGDLLKRGLQEVSEWDEDESSFIGEIVDQMYIPKAK